MVSEYEASMRELRPRHTCIRQVLDMDDGYIVLENSYKFPTNASNLYKVDYDFQPVWDAEVRKLGIGTDHYANFVFIQGKNLSCAGGVGDTYTIDPKTGKILKAEYTK